MRDLEYRWNLEQWRELQDSGVLIQEKVELIDGKIIKMSPERADHAFYVSRLANMLRHLLEPELAVVREAHPITLKLSEPEPDIVVARSPDYLYLQHHPYPEDIYWLIEVSRSTLKFDLNQKLQLYARAGIKEYWVLDLQFESFYLFQDLNTKTGMYEIKREISSLHPESIPLPGFPQLRLNSWEIWQS